VPLARDDSYFCGAEAKGPANWQHATPAQGSAAAKILTARLWRVSCSIAHVKKRKSGNRGSAGGRKSAPKSVDEYLARVPEPARGTLNKIRTAIRAALPSESTEIISYGMPAFKYKNVLVWFAAFADHCSLFPTAAVIEAFRDELKGFSTSKGTIQFPTDKPLPAALVKKMVKARLAQIQKKWG
jgi:uncharacterized protein YdhG (YjbR/CyaY superfamily)